MYSWVFYSFAHYCQKDFVSFLNSSFPAYRNTSDFSVLSMYTTTCSDFILLISVSSLSPDSFSSLKILMQLIFSLFLVCSMFGFPHGCFLSFFLLCEPCISDSLYTLFFLVENWTFWTSWWGNSWSQIIFLFQKLLMLFVEKCSHVCLVTFLNCVAKTISLVRCGTDVSILLSQQSTNGLAETFLDILTQ